MPRRALLALALLAVSWTVPLAPAAGAGEPARPWLIGYHKAFFWMSQIELRVFYEIADAYTPDLAANPDDLRLVAATPAPFAGRDWRIDFLIRRGRLAAIGLEHAARAAAAAACRAQLEVWLDALSRLHGAVGARPAEGRATLLFRRGARWEVATAYDGGLCRTRMDLVRAPPSVPTPRLR